MAKQYWVRHQGKMTGPFSGQQLKQMAATGMILTADMISADQINWQIAGQVRGLFPGEKTTGRRDSVAVGSKPDAMTACGSKLGPASDRHVAHESTLATRLHACCQGRKRWLILALAILFVSGIGWGLATAFRRPSDTDSTQSPTAISDEDTLDLGNGVTMKLVLIPAGKFLMGSPATELSRWKVRDKEEGPQRQVTISKPFYMGVCEVTQVQWRAVMGTEPWKDKPHAKSGDNNAASHISWDDASKFCKILMKKTGKNITLPTEAQWEYACRAGSKAAYCFGDDASSFGDDDWKLGDYAWYYSNAFAKDANYAHPVGQKEPNAFGLYDMHGNVWEWCRDWYDEKFYANAKNVDPENTTWSKHRVHRGGSYFEHGRVCRSASRSAEKPSCGDYGWLGFRVVILNSPIMHSTSTTDSTPDDEVKAHIERGHAHKKQGDLDAAIREYTLAIKMKADMGAYFFRGIAYDAKKEFDLAVKDYSVLIALRPDFPGGYVNRGSIYLDRKQFGEALEDFNMAVKLAPQDVKARFGLARTHRAIGNADLAIAAFSRVIELKSDHVYSHEARGKLYLGKGLHEQAMQDFSIVIQLLPKYAPAYSYRAICHEALGNGTSAVQDWTRAIALLPDGDLFYEGRARAYYSLGQYDKAWSDVKICKKLGRTVHSKFLADLRKASGRKE